MIFAVFDVCNNAGSPLKMIIEKKFSLSHC